ncbi:disulfide oxidoreductase [candidate division WOR-3 bacterium]|uniref:Disulfide oxidoreductase n=1 Tax=candidate division WOR-3 bacterium TaxID=2052148 RepID=A0A660SH98_UNCW3|nr:MAG: disulfide oxidoreductase [candidate division WOR-3 bacterium]
MITKDSSVEEVITRFPDAVAIFIKHGLPCLVCGEPFWGTIEELARKYGVDVDLLIAELNKLGDGE